MTHVFLTSQNELWGGLKVSYKILFSESRISPDCRALDKELANVMLSVTFVVSFLVCLGWRLVAVRLD